MIMLSKKEIIKKAENYVKSMEEDGKDKFSLLYDLIIEKDYGIVFFYNTLKYYKTKNEKYNILIGNAPFLIEYKSGNIIDFGTSRAEEYYIKEYEAGRWPVK